MPTSLLAILNAANNYKQTIQLTAPIEGEFCRLLANREDLVKVSFLANSYIYDVIKKSLTNETGIALCGTKIAYKITDGEFYNCVIELINKDNSPQELQIILYIF